MLAVTIVSLFFLIQLGVPSLRLAAEETSVQRFGWQMFSSFSPEIEFTVHTPDGSQIVDIQAITARLRSDIDFESLLPPHLCETVTGAERVTWEDEVFRC